MTKPTEAEFEKAQFRKNNTRVEPFVYVPARIVPGVIAIPISELKEKTNGKNS